MSFRDVFGTVSRMGCGDGLVVSIFSHKELLFLGCPTCYDRCTVNPVNGRTMQDLYLDTIRKVCYLKEQGFNVVEMWECDLKRELKEDEEIRGYFEKYDLVDPLEPRDAFFGGRTNAAKLLHECKGQEKIRLVCYGTEVVTSVYLVKIMSFIGTWTLPACTHGVTSRHV